MTSAAVIERSVRQFACELNHRTKGIQPRPWKEDSLRRELCCCILSSQVTYEVALAATMRLEDAGVFQPAASRLALGTMISSILETPLTVRPGQSYRYRFHNIRAIQLTQALSILSSGPEALTELLGSHESAFTLRVTLVREFPGVGPKQASMFLRNVGRSDDLAVIDRHVLRYMAIIGLCADARPHVATMQQYEHYEQILRYHACYVGCPVGILDTAIWVVLRVADRMRMS
jgi:N-glycosylase/DNA lyase